MSALDPSIPRPAATVMLVREGGDDGIELFMLRRSTHSAFLPNVFVFPGGAVDAHDRRVAQSGLLRAGAAEDIAHEGGGSECEVAALREAFEEAGILLAAHRDGTPLVVDMHSTRLVEERKALLAGERNFEEVLHNFDAVLDARRLWYFSRWITPATESHRFDTRFYLGIAPENQLASADDVETLDGLWIGPRQALHRAAAGEMPMIFPTIKHLERLCPFQTLDELRSFTLTKSIHIVNPVVGAGRAFALPAELEGIW